MSLPRSPEPDAPYRFPLIASVAPVVAAVAMWAITGSTFALVFAGLGPLTAAASWIDNRFGRRRTRRREAQRFLAELVVAREDIVRIHASERAHLDELTPPATAIVNRHGADPYRWSSNGQPEIKVTITVGRGTLPSTLALDSSLPIHQSPFATEVRALSVEASELERAPITVDARLGLGISGPPHLARAVARSLAVQLAWALSPADHWWAGDDEELAWMTELPHQRRTSGTKGAFYEFGRRDGQGAEVVVAVSRTPAELPGSCRVVVDLGAAGGRVVRHPDPERRGTVSLDVVSREQCESWARRIHADATADGIVGQHSGVPEAVELGPLLRDTDEGGRVSLACEPAVSAVGPLCIDLVADGPHAVIGGTTGSGKSELLIAWVLGMAAPRSPADVTFLLVDFKGGSAFAGLARLPHTVGIITDLDQAGARRALESLRAELRFRERVLVKEGVRSIDETSVCARLVIVVDEFAAMLAEHPELHALFADLAARGRSLGIHLVLCTQRPAGVVRDAVLANADLRMSLRVNNRADSSAVVGTDAAAAIPLSARGRAIVSKGGAHQEHAQFALATGADIDRVVERWAAAPRPRRPWCEPLPVVFAPDELPVTTDGIAFGLSDLPEEQRRAVAVYQPERDGHLLVIGASGCGKTTALVAIARATDSVVWIPTQCDAAWDVVGDLVAEVERDDGADRGCDRLVLVDDLDSLVARFDGDHRAGFVELLGRLLREGPSRGMRAVISVQRVSAQTQAIVASVPGRLMMGHTSRQDFVLAGGEGAQFVDNLPPGGGLWRGHRVQVVHAVAARPRDVVARVTALTPIRPLVIVTTRAAHLLDRYPDSVALSHTIGDPRDAFASTSILVGDVEEWQSRWGAIAALRSTAHILFDGCSTSDYRALTRSRHLPPPTSPGVCWLLGDDGTASRAHLPGIERGN